MKRGKNMEPHIIHENEEHSKNVRLMFDWYINGKVFI